jgi:hypothetical protein
MMRFRQGRWEVEAYGENLVEYEQVFSKWQVSITLISGRSGLA